MADLTPKPLIEHIKQVQKYFKHHHIPSALLRESAGAHRPALPSSTRWHSMLNTLDSFLHNRTSYITIAQEHPEEISAQISHLVHDFHLYSEAKSLQTLLTAVVQLIDKLQANSFTIADACELWMNLATDIDLFEHREKITKRAEQSLSVLHYLANILHPTYNGKSLSPDKQIAAENWMLEHKPDLYPTYLEFLAKSPPFPPQRFSEQALKVPALAWWKSLQQRSAIPADFISFAATLLSSPASTGSIERIFSNFSFVHNKSRNRLRVQKAAQLVFCYRFLRGKGDLNDF